MPLPSSPLRVVPESLGRLSLRSMLMMREFLSSHPCLFVFLHRHPDIIESKEENPEVPLPATRAMAAPVLNIYLFSGRRRTSGERRNLATHIAARPAAHNEQITAIMSRPGGAQYDMQIKVRIGFDGGCGTARPPSLPLEILRMLRGGSRCSPPASAVARIPPCRRVTLMHF